MCIMNRKDKFVANSEKMLHFFSDLWFNILMGQKMKLGSKVNRDMVRALKEEQFEKNRQMQEKEMEMGYTVRTCVMRMMDIGVALSSAAKTASMLNVDNRVQQRVGATARALGYIRGEVVMGIPVSISGKSIYYDRKTPAKH